MCKPLPSPDINADNIMFDILDQDVFAKFEQAEQVHPTPRKETDGRTIYLSRVLEGVNVSSLGAPVLCDFGSAAWGEEKNVKDVQPNGYRCPEVILQVPWSYEIDIWNVACLVICIFPCAYPIHQPLTDANVGLGYIRRWASVLRNRP